jgi:hypothetical protein
MKSILKKLQEDKHYYGAYGRQFLSNSNIGILLNNPAEFGKEGVETLPMLHGRYFHVSMLEPDKLDQFEVVDCSTRNTKAYKEIAGGRLILLRKEQHQLDLAIEKMKNSKFADEIYSEGAEYEVPMIDDFFGVQFKGKADIITKDKIIDIKTSSKIGNFRSSAKAYNYDSQAYIYSTMFDRPFEFFVICKETLQMKRVQCSSEFLERGRDKLERAVAVWKKFFGPNRTHDVNEFIETEVL